MLSNYIFANLGFALSVFGALVFFATGWLYFNSWKIDKQIKRELFKSGGFFLLALAALIHATSVEIPKAALAVIIPFSSILFFLIAFLYFRKATKERLIQVKPAAAAFFFLALAEFGSIAFFWQETANPFWSQTLALYGPVWIIIRLIELIGLVILAKWAWGYFRFQVKTQLFILVVSASFCFFVLTTVSFTFLLLYNLQRDALAHLRTDVRVVQYTIERLQAEALASATAVAANPAVKTAFFRNDQNSLYSLTSDLLLAYKTNFLAVTDATGRVIMRGEDKESVGDTLVFDPTVKSALGGQRLATVITLEGAIAPRIQIKASVPFYEYEGSKAVRGVISTGFWVDSAFVDGIKNLTGLDVAIFGDNKRAATTFTAPDGQTRFIGSLETNPAILETVLKKGEIFAGTADILNKPYFTAYAPLKTYSDQTIGMIFVGKLQTELLETMQKSIQLTFIGSIFFMLFSLIPAYFISRYIKENIKA